MLQSITEDSVKLCLYSSAIHIVLQYLPSLKRLHLQRLSKRFYSLRLLENMKEFDLCDRKEDVKTMFEEEVISRISTIEKPLKLFESTVTNHLVDSSKLKQWKPT